MEKRIEQALNVEISKAYTDYMIATKNYGKDSIEVREPAIRAIYHMEWWIMFANGFKPVWFTPFIFFRTTNEYKAWCDLHAEAIRNKVEKWFS